MPDQEEKTMKIDESSINHNATRLCTNVSEEVWDIIDTETAEKRAIARLAYINGVYDMANTMKEVLKN